MIRERVLTISTLLALVALSGAAYAGPKGTEKSYRSSEVGSSSQPAWYRARALQPGAAPAQIVPEGYSAQYGCRHSYQGGPLGGPKSSMTWC
jgi:hypothetical protein